MAVKKAASISFFSPAMSCSSPMGERQFVGGLMIFTALIAL